MDNISAYLKDLDQLGYCVIPKIISEEKCDYYIDKIWEWLEGLGTEIKRNDKSTWGSDRWIMNIHGIIQYPNTAHLQFIWQARDEENIKKVFSSIWETDDLLVSFDRMNIMKPSFGRKNY